MNHPYLPNPLGRDDSRLVDREEGLNLLFAAAQDVAREEGKLADGMYGSLEHSRISSTSFTLMSASGQLIARVSLAKAREVIGMRRQIARDMTRKAKLEITHRCAGAIKKPKRAGNSLAHQRTEGPGGKPIRPFPPGLSQARAQPS